MTVIHFFSSPGISKGAQSAKLNELQTVSPLVLDLETELCYNVEVTSDLDSIEKDRLKWLLTSPFQTGALKEEEPFLKDETLGKLLIEIGPRLNFSTPFSSNALSMCKAIGLKKIVRLEVSVRYLILFKMEGIKISKALEDQIVHTLHDQMTQCRYTQPIASFDHGIKPTEWSVVDILGHGKQALEEINERLGLAFDDWDLEYYTNIFKNTLSRNPTTVECFDLAQSNSEHSRHFFFKGKMILDGIEQEQSLIDMIIDTQKTTNPNNVIQFSDNSSAIKGFSITKIKPSQIDSPSCFTKQTSDLHLTFTAETHNFPTAVAPFSGATTGTGGRIRDGHAVGRGGYCIAGTAGYSVGNLFIPGYDAPWEDKNFVYPSNFAKPLDVIVEASSGASDYGNKFGEPLICGFARSFGQKDKAGVRREWVKPIMFSGGVGSMEANMITKFSPEKGMKVVKIGGPVYRIGVGGGSASSVQVQGDNQQELDFGAVQRGDPEMENKLNRIVRACIEHTGGNPICSIHDQGAGGNGNVLKEIVEPEGAVIFTSAFTLGDDSISTLELWGAEYQENDAILVKPTDVSLLMKLSQRERCPVDVVGVVTGNRKVILSEETLINETQYLDGSYVKRNTHYPFNLDLDLVLGKMPRKEFILNEEPVALEKLQLQPDLTVTDALNLVLRHLSVCSKRFLTNKVDRCVTGLIAQQQCVGPLHTPLADFAVTALSMFNEEGVATSIGEQPIKGLVDPSAGARMTVAEALTNLMFAKISCLEDVKCSGNWMWAAKLPGEGAALFKACQAMCEIMSQLGIAVDGGKDSLSMAARVDGETVKSPGTLVVSTYAPCPNIHCKVTPDIKSPAAGEAGVLLWVSLSDASRLGGSILAQCFGQLGDNVPDVDDPEKLKKAFNVTQRLLSERMILSGHDISDGGLITSVLEMAIGGISGLQVLIECGNQAIDVLFAEEVGWVLEVSLENVDYVQKCYSDEGVKCRYIGQAVGYGMSSTVTITNEHGSILLNNTIGEIFSRWEETSYRLERRQANVDCVSVEFNDLKKRKGPKFSISFDPDEIIMPRKLLSSAPRVAVLREEGTNGDREMSASLVMAGFEVWDVTMEDLLNGTTTTDNFRGIIFPGGFSYADVLGSAKGWAACLKFNETLKAQMDHFVKRSDSFSLGVCNGCQLMALLGWIGSGDVTGEPTVILDHNSSERFECRFSTVRVNQTPAIMCRGMEGSILGVWVAHGEGRFTYRNNEVKRKLEERKCIPFAYVNDDGKPTEDYPMNPNGSEGGVAGVCSADGRHLALMPHPERCTLMWQWPYVSPNLKYVTTSPWLRLFDNAFIWANENSR